MTADAPAAPTGLPARVLASVAGRARAARAAPALNRLVLRELISGRLGGHPADPADRPHLDAAIGWLAAAQDATPDDGIARGFSLGYDPYFRRRGWQASYPETTGYIIPTLFNAARLLDDPALAARAERAARWEIDVQLDSGAVQGGVVGAPRSPAVFNTGQVMLGWLSAYEETGDPVFAEATRRAARFLVEALSADGHWRRGNSRFARSDTTLYNARTAWALAEAGVRLGSIDFGWAARRNLWAVVREQHENGWFPDCCLYDPSRPLLHTIAYTIRGLLEGGRVLEDEGLLRAAQKAAAKLASAVRHDGFMAGQFASDWSPRASWSCLTGQAQMVNVWLRLHEITGEARWLAPVPSVIGFLKSTQNRTSAEPGVRGGIRGSEPVTGEYGPGEILAWATKFFADALMRRMLAEGRADAGSLTPLA